MNLRRIGTALALVLGALTASEGALAQYLAIPESAQTQYVPNPEATIPERQSVLQRPRPDYDALGLPFGSFIFYPSVGLTETYNSNVFVTPSDVKSDFFTTLLPTLQLKSDWNNHALNFAAAGEINRYVQQVGENDSNFLAATDGRIDIQRDIYLTGILEYQLTHEPRTSPNTVVNQKNPIEVQVATGGIGYVHESGRLGFRINGGVDYYAYGNGLTTTGATVPETGRNVTIYSVTPQVSYEIQPGYHAFLRTVGDWRVYQAEFDAGGFDRSSSGYQVNAGTAINLGPTLNGEVFVGYFDQEYDDPRLQPASGPGFGGNLLWNVTDLTSVRGTVARTVEETIVGNASSYVQTASTLSIEHELLRNVLLNGGGSYIVQDFQGLARTDTIYVIAATARYLLNRNVSVGLDFTHSHRDSTTPGIAYDLDLVTASLRLQY
jgi:hypothetical protein